MTDPMQIEINAEAWRAEPGPILLLAGPGTGKTQQLALRIKYLVEDKHVSPDAITVITFTKEAAQNMRRRIADEEKPDVYLPIEARPERIMTMHSLGLEIVRAHADLLGMPQRFRVLTESRLRPLLFRDAALIAGYGEEEAAESNRLRQNSAKLPSGSPIEKITKGYESILRACGSIDYDDQILLASHLLSEKGEIQAK